MNDNCSIDYIFIMYTHSNRLCATLINLIYYKNQTGFSYKSERSRSGALLLNTYIKDNKYSNLFLYRGGSIGNNLCLSIAHVIYIINKIYEITFPDFILNMKRRHEKFYTCRLVNYSKTFMYGISINFILGNRCFGIFNKRKEKSQENYAD